MTKERIRCAAEELGYHTLKPEQLDVVFQFRDAFAVLPTGFGKSLCYACLPSTFDKILKKEQLLDTPFLMASSVVSPEIQATERPLEEKLLLFRKVFQWLVFQVTQQMMPLKKEYLGAHISWCILPPR